MGRLGRTVPALPVTDVVAAVRFYRERLGFAVAHEDDGFAVLVRDDARLHLWQAADRSWQDRADLAAGPVRSGAESFLAGTASARIETDDPALIEDLHAEFAAAGVLHPVSGNGVTRTDFGTLEVAVLDLEGNLLEFVAWLR